MPIIEYKDGYKYQLYEEYSIKTGIKPDQILASGGFVKLGTDGTLTTKKGYAWDGASGPVIDTPRNMRGSLVHDALYQLMRGGLLKGERKAADKLFQKICIEDGTNELLAWGYYRFLRKFGGSYTKPGSGRPVLTAPQSLKKTTS